MTMMTRRRFRAFATIGALAATGLALASCSGDGGTGGGDDTHVLTFASWATPDSSNEAIHDRWIEMVEEASDGRITFEVSAGGSLCAADEIPKCVQDGRADVGQTISDYAPQLFPQSTIVSIPFLTQDADAAQRALYELRTEHEGAAQLWEENNLKMIGHWTAGRLLLGSEEPVESIEDVAELPWRLAGPYLQEAVKTIGGDNVALTAPETYEAVERGVVDGVAFPMDGLVSFQLKDILPTWTDPGIGQYTTVGQWMNRETFEGLPEDLQQVIDDVNAEFNNGVAMEVFREVTNEQCDVILDTIGDITEWDQAATDEWKEAVGDSLEQKWIDDSEANGLSDAAGYLELYKEKLAEYAGQTEEDPSLACSGRS